MTSQQIEQQIYTKGKQMAIKKTNKRVKCGYLVTPIGKALWVSAPNPSAFDESKTEATVILSTEDTEIFKKELKAMCAEGAKELGINLDEAIDNYIKPNTDADGNPTGEYRIKAKTGMQYAPTFADAKGKTFKPEPGFSVPNRSDIRLSIGVELQVVKPTFQGIVARLRGIQIINLQSFGADFDEVEGGFSADEAVTPTTTTDWGDATADASGWE